MFRSTDAEARQQAAERERQAVMRRWEYARGRAEAHTRMPDTMYASTPSTDVPPHARPGMAPATSGGMHGTLADDPLSVTQGAAAAANVRTISYFPSASDALGRQGFARVVNRSDAAGTITILAVDDAGVAAEALTLEIAANATVHFNSADLENGNAGKGLAGAAGPSQGGWRLDLSADFDFDAYAYIRTGDGFLTSMHDTVPQQDGAHRVAIFNPGSNMNQESLLRLINAGDTPAAVEITGTDDAGNASEGTVRVEIPAGESLTYTAAELETGGAPGLAGALGDGRGKWRLAVESDGAVAVMSLLSSPTGHLTNLSTAPEVESDGPQAVPLFPSASDALGRQGFVRVVNHTDDAGEVTIRAYDDTDREYEALTLSIGARETKHFNSNDLEGGAPSKDLSGSTGGGEGEWRLELTSDLDIAVLSYIRTPDGFLTAIHDVAPIEDGRHRVVTFNPGSNSNQASVLRLVNAGAESERATITGIDDRGASPGSAVAVTISAGGSRTLTAAELESGADGLEGALGDGTGKWRLEVESDHPITVMSLLSSPTAHLTNLSTAPRGGETVEEVYALRISPIVQSKCVNCHVEGGASGNTRLVFGLGTNETVRSANLQVFRDFLDEVEDGADYVLNKIQGALGHGGGIQVTAGTDEYEDMERFLAFFGDDAVDGSTVTVDTLFDGVKMESARSTLRRAAIVFAGRIPKDKEYESIEAGGLANLGKAVRGLMEGPEFHEFLIRASNDRLLTDRQLKSHTIGNDGRFVDFDNEYYRLNETDPFGVEQQRWHARVQFGAGRAPLELIAHVVENDLDYREILTADYIMANPFSARAYGAGTSFRDSQDAHEFKPSEIVSYYRLCDGHDSEFTQGVGLRVNDPGPCVTNFPHAGVLNTMVFLKRYPSTATNRNRARSRWTYYHFLGVDIEKSASRTTDPVALADTNNPTLNNPACTVCHTVLDPVAGSFQNYGDEGYYKDQWGGLDSLDAYYRENRGNEMPVTATEGGRGETLSWTLRLVEGGNDLAVDFTNDFYDENTGEDGFLYLDVLRIADESGGIVETVEFETIGPPMAPWGPCGGDRGDHLALWNGGSPECTIWIDIGVPATGNYTVEVVAWADSFPHQYPGGYARMAVSANGYREGDTWYRDMRVPGFAGENAPSTDNSVQWLAREIANDARFSEAAVEFWWPSVMGAEVAEPPAAEGDAGFRGSLLASNAQSAEVHRLAQGFRRGFGGGVPYNLKDLLVEIAVSKWFRAESLENDDAVRLDALANAGARRLLTPEELARKTAALTGFQWGRQKAAPWTEPRFNGVSALTDAEGYGGYRLFYGGIDSDGITKRARDLSSVMAGVAKSHAVEVSCPIVLRDFYLLPDERRRLFAGMDVSTTPVSEFSAEFEVEAKSWSDRQTFGVAGPLSAGAKTVGMVFTNNDGDDRGGDRNIRLYELRVRDSQGTVVEQKSLKDLVPPVAPWGECGNANDYNSETGERDHFNLHSTCGPVTVEFQGGAAGTYTVEVVAWADQFGDELAKLEVSIDSDTADSAGAAAIRGKLVDLHEALLGVSVGDRSREIEIAYRLFVDVWDRSREVSGTILDSYCNVWSDFEYFDGILDDVILEFENDDGFPYYGWDEVRVNKFLYEEIDPQDTHGVARAWVAVLAYMLMDYRYLYL